MIKHLFVIGLEYKHCLKCNRWRQVNNFHRNKTTADRLSVYCKACVSKGGKRGRRKGYIMSQETKNKISQGNMNKVLSFEHKQKISKTLMGNTNRRINFSTLVDDLFEDYVESYSDENIGHWISENRKALEEADIKSEHELGSMSIRDVKLFETAGTGIFSIDPLQLMLIAEELNE